jgi:hypothetical protein
MQIRASKALEREGSKEACASQYPDENASAAVVLLKLTLPVCITSRPTTSISPIDRVSYARPIRMWPDAPGLGFR